MFDYPDPLFPNYHSFGFYDNNQMDVSFAQILTFYPELLMESFWLNFLKRVNSVTKRSFLW